jgi:hypothetical protein
MPRPARKILTAALTLAAASAAASPGQPTLPIKWTEAKGITVVLIDNTPYLVTPGTAPMAISTAEFGRYLGETQPLVGPDGRPGCGNILSKGPTGCDEAQQKALAARVQAAAADAKVAERESAYSKRAAERVVRAQQAMMQARAAKK